jgi:hypothetical protein
VAIAGRRLARPLQFGDEKQVIVVLRVLPRGWDYDR